MAVVRGVQIRGANGPNPVVAGKGTMKFPLRAAAVLTDSYVASSHMPCDAVPCVGAWVAYNAAIDYTSIQTIPQGSYDGTAWFDLAAADSKTIASLGSGASAAGGFTVKADVSPGVRFFRVLIKKTGGTAVGAVSVTGITGCVA